MSRFISKYHYYYYYYLRVGSFIQAIAESILLESERQQVPLCLLDSSQYSACLNGRLVLLFSTFLALLPMLCALFQVFQLHLVSLSPSIYTDYYYYYYYYYYFFAIFSHSGLQTVFYWRLCNNKSPQVSWTFLSILTNLNNPVIWMISYRPPNSNSSSPFLKKLRMVTSAQVIIIFLLILNLFFYSL